MLLQLGTSQVVLLWIYAVAGIALILFFKWRRGLGRSESPYRKRGPLMTNAERNFLQSLRQVVSETYDIYPQIALGKIIDVENGTGHRRGFWNRVDRLFVDFVLCDKVNSVPVLVIELDDSSHAFPNRIERDEVVDRALQHAGIPIRHIRALAQYDIASLKQSLALN